MLVVIGNILIIISLKNSLLIPPLIGFFAKQQVLYSATHTGYYFLSIVAILVSVISASYYLKIVKVMHFESIPNSAEQNIEKPNVEISNIHSYVISTFTLIILLFMLNPSLLLNSTELLSLSLFTS
jgi:NADH-ubiquinone oxidoreductase chain 2